MPLRMLGRYCLTVVAVFSSASSSVMPICTKRSPPVSDRLTTRLSSGRKVGTVTAALLALPSSSSPLLWRLDSRMKAAAAPMARTAMMTISTISFLPLAGAGAALLAALGVADTGIPLGERDRHAHALHARRHDAAGPWQELFGDWTRSEEHTSELQSQSNLVC